MKPMKAAAIAHPNIAFIKYWGIRDEECKLPSNDSISMNIGCLSTRTSVAYDPQLTSDTLTLNGERVEGEPLSRVSQFLDRIRKMAGANLYAHIDSENNFPIGAGIASSASAFAALALAGTAGLGLNLSEEALSRLARFGSGSACRSVPGGFVEWRTNEDTGESYAFSIASKNHWALVDLVAILSDQHKQVGSEAGMLGADTSPLQAARIQDAPRRLELCRSAILNRDFDALAQITEQDSNLMHAVMMTSHPPLFYWHPQSLAIMLSVRDWRAEGIPVTYTLDAGPNVHVICLQEAMPEVLSRLQQITGIIDVLKGVPAGPARLLQPY